MAARSPKRVAGEVFCCFTSHEVPKLNLAHPLLQPQLKLTNLNSVNFADFDNTKEVPSRR